MSDEPPTEIIDQAEAQCRVVVHLCKALIDVYQMHASLFVSHPEAHGKLAQMIGERSARLMEEIGDHLSGIDAVDEEDEWTSSVYAKAHSMFPLPPRCKYCSGTGLEMSTDRKKDDDVARHLNDGIDGSTTLTDNSGTDTAVITRSSGSDFLGFPDLKPEDIPAVAAHWAEFGVVIDGHRLTVEEIEAQLRIDGRVMRRS